MILNLKNMKNKIYNKLAIQNIKSYSVLVNDLKSRFDSNLISQGDDFQKLTIVR